MLLAAPTVRGDGSLRRVPVRLGGSFLCRSAFVVAFVGTLAACAPAPAPDDSGVPGDLLVDLAWIPAAADPEWDRARVGLWWALSNLGATPPVDEAGISVLEQDARGVRFTLDLAAVGFHEDQLPAVADAIAPVRAWTDEPVDVGRFLMAVLYDPSRYYAITGACATLSDWRAAREAPDPLVYGVVVSLLLSSERLVTFNAADGDIDTLGWWVAEGEGSVTDDTFQPDVFESVDVMTNGQQRFAVYDEAGELVPGTPGPTGQPGTCMWCHEQYVQRGTAANPGADAYLSYDAWIEEVDRAEAAIGAARSERATAIDWAYPVHEHAEQLTRAFLEPDAARVAAEWGVDVEEVEALGLPTHTSEEFPELDALYARADVDAARAERSPGWLPLPVPVSDRAIPTDWPIDRASARCRAP